MTLDDSFNDTVVEIKNYIKFTNDDYCRTEIYYEPVFSKFTVDISNHWKKPVRDDVIDFKLKKFELCGWIRTNNTNISSLKELMNRDDRRGK